MSAEFVFCKRCGAVTKPGICTNCGFDMYKDLNIDTDNNSNSENFETVNNTTTVNTNAEAVAFTGAVNTTETNANANVQADATPAKKKKGGKGLIIGLCVGIPIALVTIILCIIVVGIVASPFLIKYVIPTSVSNSIYNNLSKQASNTPMANLIPVPEEEEEEEDDDYDYLADIDPYLDYGSLINDDGKEYSSTIDGVGIPSAGYDEKKFEGYTSSANEYFDLVVGENDKKDMFVNGNYDSYLSFNAAHGEHDRDAYPTPYLTSLDECYEECADYSVERHVIKYEGQNNGVYVSCSSAYYTIKSDTVDFSAVNDKLKERAVIGLYDFLENSSNTSSSVFNYSIYSDAIITYNNDEVMSIVYDYTSYSENVADRMTVYGVNIDMKNGSVFDNTKILNMDDDFAQFFVDRSNIQNRYLNALNESSSSDISKVLNDDDSLIMFFTPFGIEVGMVYRYQGTSGWVTVTINDFDKYLAGNYTFNTDWGKNNYDVYQYEKDNGITPKTTT